MGGASVAQQSREAMRSMWLEASKALLLLRNRRRRLLQCAQIMLADMLEHCGAGRIAQIQHSGEVSSGWLDRLLDDHVNRRPSREPLIAAQQRAHAAQHA